MRRRLWAVLVAAAAAAVVTLATPQAREAVLSPLGTALVVHEALHPVEAIVVTLDSEAAGALEAADLVAAGIAKRVLVFDEELGPTEREIERRGLVPNTRTSEQVALLAALRVNDVARIPVASDSSGTTVESLALAAWCRGHGVRSVLVVTTPDHSQRVRRVMRRALEPLGTDVSVRGATHSGFDAQNWWNTIDGRRTVAFEWQKLILDVVSHPF